MAKYVDFLDRTLRDARGRLLTVTVEDGQLVIVRGGGRLAERLGLARGVRLADGEVMQPEDGDAFLEALHHAFRGAVLRATEPYELSESL